MPVPASINDLSTTAGNNSPAGSESPTTADDYLRQISAFIAELRDTKQPIYPAFTGRNKLINGDMRINQRGFNGTWTGLAEGAYGFDRWKRSGTNIQQVIEDGNFKPNTVHTLSGAGVTTQQITSPASGHWTITVPNTATNVQVEEGLVATPFEHRPIGVELALCQRYFWRGLPLGGFNFNSYISGGTYTIPVQFPVAMRATPTMAFNLNQASAYATTGALDVGSTNVGLPTTYGARLIARSTAQDSNANGSFSSTAFISADAEL